MKSANEESSSSCGARLQAYSASGENNMYEASQQQATDSYLSGFHTFLKQFKASGWFDFGDDIDSTRNVKATTQRRECVTLDEDLARFKKAASVLLRTPQNGGIACQETNDYTHIRLCQQLETWDCGIACIQMIMRWLRQDTMEFERDTRKLTSAELSERDWMLQTVGTESVWTIDLVLLLEKMFDLHKAETSGRCTASYLFCSTNMGVDTSYHGLGYYQGAFQRDEVRVNHLFEQARTMGLPTLCIHSLGLIEVLDTVSNENCVAIVLLDNSILLGNRKEDAEASHFEKAASQSGQTGGKDHPDRRDEHRNCGALHSDTYAGHYVVLCGMSFNPVDIAHAEVKDGGQRTETDYCLVVKNPASCSEVDFVTPSHFERSWRSKGTDEDIIFVAKHC